MRNKAKAEAEIYFNSAFKKATGINPDYSDAMADLDKAIELYPDDDSYYALWHNCAAENNALKRK